jgi:flagellar hook-basal body complex protein FliE
MSLPIVPIASIQPISLDSIAAAVPQASSGAPGAFQSFLTSAMGQVQQTQQNADSLADKFLSGENQEVHQVALAATQNELAFDMFMQVRNKIVSAYQEVMRMQM